MAKSMFTNALNIRASREEIVEALTQLPAILSWDKEIIAMEALAGGSYRVKRNASAYVQEELLTIKSQADGVLYQATSADLNYQIDWKLSEDEGSQLLSQELIIEEALNPVVIGIAKTVTKLAFQRMLGAVKQLVETKGEIK
ncbi:hypothetical protein [Lactococcus termiticola]|uniref:SRPBCC family protein n=1 Tax=Lactococcus termiticola TaxID=2169526 RepID=A0A2R5HDW3_9LACT|nr:hypothetical protein [Lactococcus termiticola]GBG96239.1 hypothetical protein NtB2_00350 [Lactococcus termiticola]